MRAHLEQWANWVWEKHNGTGRGVGDSQEKRRQNIGEAIEGLREAHSNSKNVDALTKELRTGKQRNHIAPLFEEALRKEMDCD